MRSIYSDNIQFDDWSIFEIIKDNVKRNLQCN